MPNALKHRTLSSAIVDRLRSDILEGTYAAGAQLRQDALAELYEVSRIPIREALFQLEDEGLVRIEPHKGAVVTSLSLDEIHDVFDLRVTLERRLLVDAIPRMTSADFTRLEAVQQKFEEATASGDLSRSGALNAEFHVALYAAATLPRTSSVVAGLLQTSDRYTRLQLSAVRALARAKREHRALIALCRKRQLKAAGDMLVEHIESVRADLSGVLKNRLGVNDG